MMTLAFHRHTSSELLISIEFMHTEGGYPNGFSAIATDNDILH